ncbi:MAG: hypothetical protein PHY02_05510 [Phycisphaerae bacterium]|nr:hypothetical protein [Phycisphaerae bacterium]
MFTKKNLVMLAVVLIAGAALLIAGESVKVQGLVGVTTNAEGVITAVTLTAQDGVVYNVTLDEQGLKLGTDMADKNVEVEGAVVDNDGQNWITVQSYTQEQE